MSDVKQPEVVGSGEIRVRFDGPGENQSCREVAAETGASAVLVAGTVYALSPELAHGLVSSNAHWTLLDELPPWLAVDANDEPPAGEHEQED